MCIYTHIYVCICVYVYINKYIYILNYLKNSLQNNPSYWSAEWTYWIDDSISMHDFATQVFIRFVEK